jgi:hypothetical protein
MELDPRLPQWEYGHPDKIYLCAYLEGVSEQVYRFERVVPEGWTQVKRRKGVRRWQKAEA